MSKRIEFSRALRRSTKNRPPALPQPIETLLAVIERPTDRCELFRLGSPWIERRVVNSDRRALEEGDRPAAGEETPSDRPLDP